MNSSTYAFLKLKFNFSGLTLPQTSMNVTRSRTVWPNVLQKWHLFTTQYELNYIIIIIIYLMNSWIRKCKIWSFIGKIFILYKVPIKGTWMSVTVKTLSNIITYLYFHQLIHINNLIFDIAFMYLSSSQIRRKFKHIGKSKFSVHCMTLCNEVCKLSVLIALSPPGCFIPIHFPLLFLIWCHIHFIFMCYKCLWHTVKITSVHSTLDFHLIWGKRDHPFKMHCSFKKVWLLRASTHLFQKEFGKYKECTVIKRWFTSVQLQLLVLWQYCTSKKK